MNHTAIEKDLGRVGNGHEGSEGGVKFIVVVILQGLYPCLNLLEDRLAVFCRNMAIYRYLLERHDPEKRAREAVLQKTVPQNPHVINCSEDAMIEMQKMN